jgi:hypothetical protein
MNFLPVIVRKDQANPHTLQFLFGIPLSPGHKEPEWLEFHNVKFY